jgi:3-methyladenine DNA glycosylase/8-oxoguanine DNA glycosylase
MEALVPAVLEQKVTSTEAWQGWATLLRWYGERAPGPCPPRLRVPPDAETWRRIPSWDWHRAGVGPQRSQTIVRATRVAARLEECLELAHEVRAVRLRTVQGVGVWTAAEVLQRACGDPDAVSVGDLHLPRLVVWALTGEVSDSDDDMLACLEPYRGHRYRVTRLLEMSGIKSPRFGPRLAPRDFRAI